MKLTAKSSSKPGWLGAELSSGQEDQLIVHVKERTVTETEAFSDSHSTFAAGKFACNITLHYIWEAIKSQIL